MKMSIIEKIRILLVKRGNISEAELARRMGISPQNLNNKMKRANFTEKDLADIAAALDCTLSINFTLNDTGETLWKLTVFTKRYNEFSEQKHGKKGRFSPFFVALIHAQESSCFSEQGAVVYGKKYFLISAFCFSWYTRLPNHFLIWKTIFAGIDKKGIFLPSNEPKESRTKKAGNHLPLFS